MSAGLVAPGGGSGVDDDLGAGEAVARIAVASIPYSAL